MSDYYDPHPRMRLPKAVVLGGQLGCGAPAVGRNVASRIGLSFSEVDHLIEHDAGMSLAKLAFEVGRERIELRAEAVLARLLRRSPFGLIALDHAWLPPTARDLLRRQSVFVHLSRTPGYLARRLPAELHRAGDWIVDDFPLEDAPLENAQGMPLQAVFDRRAPLLRESHIVLEAGDQHASRVADLLLDSFEQISGAEAL